jgi:hypothetical protein
MALATALRTPYRARTLVRASGAGVSDADLRTAIAAAMAALVALSAARVAIDGVQGHASVEGAVALMLLLFLARRLVLDALRTRRREETFPAGDSPYRSMRPRSIL